MNLKSLILLSETLLIELTKIHFKAIVQISFYENFNIILIENIKSYCQINELFLYIKIFLKVFSKLIPLDISDFVIKRKLPKTFLHSCSVVPTWG